MLGALIRRGDPAAVERSLSLSEYAALLAEQQSSLTFNGVQYGLGIPDMSRMGANAYDVNGPVASLVGVRSSVFSEIKFCWQNWSNGRPGDTWSDASLEVLDKPWTNGTTQLLLSAMEFDGSIYGNAYYVRESAAFINADVLTRLDPCKTSLLWGATADADGRQFGRRLLAYGYREHPGDREQVVFLPSEVAHYRPPLPDGSAPGMVGRSWLSAVLPDARADSQMTEFKQAFLRNGATPSLVVSFSETISPEAFEKFASKLDANHSGWHNSFKTLYLGGGADVKTVGLSFEQLSLRATQGAGESRLAAAAGVPASVVGFSEGLAGSSLNTGNYTAARRRFADGTIRPLWRAACGALETVATPPPGSRLWYYDGDVSFLQEDVRDEAEIRQMLASTVETLIRAGYKPDAAVRAAMTGDLSELFGGHTNLYSVQLQPPGAATPTAAAGG